MFLYIVLQHIIYALKLILMSINENFHIITLYIVEAFIVYAQYTHIHIFNTICVMVL